MFSIVIPLYNKAAYIEKAIRSVLNQTFQEFELIVVDDGSTDESFAQLSVISYQLSVEDPEGFSKVKIVQQLNQGVSTTRNNGVKLANYDYIAFLDADDWWEPTYLEEMKGLIEAYPEAGIYGSSYYKVKDGQNIVANIGVELGFTKGLINYCQVYARTFYMPLWTGATIIKKTVFESEHGFKPEFILGEDFDLWIRVALKYPVAFLNTPLAYYDQDVAVADKAVVKDRIYTPESIYIFNLDYLWEEEQRNKDLKQLLDLLRVYTFERYRLQRAYPGLVRKEIAKVNFSQQKKWYWFLYHLPVPLVQFLYAVRKILIRMLK
jgi:glycosyltransferase involved in cell wall biosynthesis